MTTTPEPVELIASSVYGEEHRAEVITLHTHLTEQNIGTVALSRKVGFKADDQPLSQRSPNKVEIAMVLATRSHHDAFAQSYWNSRNK